MISARVSPIGALAAFLVLFGSWGTGKLLEARMSAHATRDLHLTSLPSKLGSWQAQDDMELSELHHDILRLDEYIRRCEVQITGWEFLRRKLENPDADLKAGARTARRPTL